MRDSTVRKIVLWVPAALLIVGFLFVWWLAGFIL